MSDHDIFGGSDGGQGNEPTAPRPGGQQSPSPWGGGSPGEGSSGQDSPFVDKGQFATALDLPKGGGAVRSMGEKFEANAFTGSSGMSVPLALSPGRSGGLAPSLALAYSSGSGNGPFGHGWTLGLPAVSRKTERGLPRYRDDSETDADVFVLAGAEDLVPERDAQGQRVILEREDFFVHRYRPRVEGGFSRIERWVHRDTRRVHWRTISRGNVHSFYGRDPSRNSTVHDPEQPEKVFRWLLDEVRDDRGHVVVYEYAAEDLAGVHSSPIPNPAERSRGASTAQRYPKRIFYGNATPHVASDWLFEVVFDYGEHGQDLDGELDISPAPMRSWPARPDAFSSFRPGFDLRTRRLCRRVLMFHRIPELDAEPTLVAATVLTHGEDPRVTRVDAITHVAYEKNPDTGRFVPAEFPALSFSYSKAAPASAPKTLDSSALEGLPAGIDGAALRFVDLHGEALPGILAEHAGVWFYKRNLGRGRFGPPEVLPKPTAMQLSAGASLTALGGAGPKLLVDTRSPLAGYVDRRDGETTLHPDGTGREWGEFVAFEQLPTADLDHPDAQRLDLAGDGFPDLVIPRGEHLDWYRSAGKRGFEAGKRVALPRDQHGPPRLVFRDPQRAVLFADMTGDGLADLVCVSNGGVHYWSNLGYGRFGPRTAMGGDTLLDHPDHFSPARVKLVDLDGTGPSDLLYLGARGCFVRSNLSGNRFSEAQRIHGFPVAHASGTVDVLDLEGRGSASLVWSSSLGADRGLQLRHLDLTGPQKPNLLVEVDNNRGLVTRTRYAPSTDFYLRDRAAGKPWATCLPYPVQVVERVETHDQISQQKAVRHYAYHHGYHDAHEREFRGFGMVETWDTESFEAFSDGDASLFAFEHAPSNTVEEKLHQPPVHTKTWMHVGAFAGWERVSAIFAREYYSQDPEALKLSDSTWPAGLTPAEAREAARALRGRVLRSEVYALDGDPLKEAHPYTVSEGNFSLARLQPRGAGEQDHGVFLVHGRESLTTHYDRNPADPRMSHSFVLEVDAFGTALQSAALVYPRRSSAPDLHPEQSVSHVSLSEAAVLHDHVDTDRLRLGVGLESKSFELRGFDVSATSLVDFETLRSACASAPEVPYTAGPPVGTDKRLLGHSRARYYADDLSGPLPEGQVGTLALPYDSLTRALDETQFTDVFGALDHAPTVALMESEGGYRYEAENDGLWLVSGHAIPEPALFYAATTFVDPFGNQYTTTLDAHALLPVSASSPLGHTVQVQNDYRLLTAWEQTDINGTRSQVAFDTRGVVIKSAILGPDGEGDTLDEPTATFEYELFRFRDLGLPNRAHARARETHGDPDTAWHSSYAYFGGAGQPLLVKAQAEPGPAPKRDASGVLVLDAEGNPVLEDTSPALRWIGNGRTILDNKGQVIRQYEPYFSSTFEYEDEAELVEQGVSPLMHYDPAGRVTRTDLPDGTFSRVEVTPWQVTSYDPNDTVADSQWYAERLALSGATLDEQKEKRAASLALAHHDTPSRAVLDSLGRPFLAIEDLGGGELLETRAELDIRGQATRILDARGNVAEERTYGFLGQLLTASSVDAGARWGLTTILGEPLRAWDQRGQCSRATFDALRRPVDAFIQPASGPELLLSRTLYGDILQDPDATKHRGRVYRSYAGGGESTVVAYDFKGQPTRVEQRLLLDPEAKNDWTPLASHTTIDAMAAAAALLLEDEQHVLASESTLDALGRPLTALSPDGSSVTYAYNQRGLLQALTCHHRGAGAATPIVSAITYDVRGRQTSITRAANAAVTTHDYDPLTFRLRHIQTTRTVDGLRLQDLRYHYDPVGNITDIQDDAQQTVYFQNQVVEAANSYVYDALYRLTEATGREHATQGTTQRSAAQLPPDSAVAPMANDPNALRRYTQRYAYDSVGNLSKVTHAPATGTGWTRHYQYATTGNRLVSTSAPGDSQGPLYSDSPTYSHAYAHDLHGNLAAMPHLQTMEWDELEQLHRVEVGSQTIYCQYAGGQRVRKFVVHSGSTTEERIYAGPFERYRKRVNGVIKEEWESLHVPGGVLVETRTVQDSAPVVTPTPVWRYQLSNHLGSATTEISETGAVISHEEYHPYGTSAYRMVDNQVDVPAKRYRFTGMERDEETGLSYHSARYYAPWLGRWTAADPIGLGDGVNRFAYVGGNPTGLVDPTGTEDVRAPDTEIEVSAPKTSVSEAIDYYSKDRSSIPYMLDSNIWSQDEKEAIVAGVAARLVPTSGGGFGLDVAKELHQRSIDAVYDYLVASEELLATPEATALAVDAIAHDVNATLSTTAGRRQVAIMFGEGLLDTIDKGIVGIDDYQEAAAKGDVEAGADATMDVSSGAVALSAVVAPVAGAVRATGRVTRVARTRRTANQAARREAAGGGAASERAAVKTAEREAAAEAGVGAGSRAATKGRTRRAGSSAGGDSTPLFRAVEPAELAELQSTGVFQNPYGIENKYFSTTLDGAAEEAKLLYSFTEGRPLTLVETSIPRNHLQTVRGQGGILKVDGAVPTVVVPTDLLPVLAKPSILNFSPLPRS